MVAIDVAFNLAKTIEVERLHVNNKPENAKNGPPVFASQSQIDASTLEGVSAKRFMKGNSNARQESATKATNKATSNNGVKLVTSQHP